MDTGGVAEQTSSVQQHFTWRPDGEQAPGHGGRPGASSSGWRVLICCCPVFSGRAGGPPTLQLHPEDEPVHTERGEWLQPQGQALDEEDREL